MSTKPDISVQGTFHGTQRERVLAGSGVTGYGGAQARGVFTYKEEVHIQVRVLFLAFNTTPSGMILTMLTQGLEEQVGFGKTMFSPFGFGDAYLCIYKSSGSRPVASLPITCKQYLPTTTDPIGNSDPTTLKSEQPLIEFTVYYIALIGCQLISVAFK